MTLMSFNRETVYNSGSFAEVGLMGRVKNFMARTRAERQLLMLDDRLLSDIGVSRSEISSRVWGA